MTAHISHITTTGQTLAVTVERLSDGAFFNPTTGLFSAGLSYAQKKTPMTEGASENATCYTAQIANLSGASGQVNPGLLRFRVHNDSGPTTIHVFEAYVIEGAIVRPDALITSRPDIDAIDEAISRAISDPVLGVLIPELSTMPSSTPSLAQLLSWLYMAATYRLTSTTDAVRVHNRAGTPIFEATIADTESRTERGKYNDAVGG